MLFIGIKEGRLLFANLKKSIAYSLAHLVPEVLPVLLWAFVGMPQPMGSLLALCIDLLTELVPATSFAYERAESLIMQVPPRNPKTDKLTSFNLLFYAYGQAGIILTGGCFLTFFLAFQFYGLSASDVVNTNNSYFPAAPDSNDIYKTSDGRVYDEGKQNHILFVVQAAWYMGIVVGQASHVFVCRTSTVSIFEHGVFTNNITNIGVVVAIALGCFVVYTPGLQDIVQSRNPFSLHILYCALLNFVAHWSTTEARKYMTRNYPEMWLNKYLAW